MSRLSRATLSNRGPRDSVFNRGTADYRVDAQSYKCPADLEECVASLEDCCEEAHEIGSLLRAGTQDLPRMTKIIENQIVFALAPSSTLQRYKRDLIDEVEPAITELVEKAQAGLQALEKKEKALETKLKAAQNRPILTSQTTAAQKLEQRRLVALTKQRERLEDELKALEKDVVALERSSLCT
ncbi:MAG: Spc19-domain-containing protein [Lentinula lateritia]|uniref:DASH complex subunit SPC19 n=1 Tax=Lentinula lateritia TaxID=40482 RepID=A0ABQ8VD89_9AGAR|nr:MAG: Spc19-domain-containing protein [Lentinula lateritia]KAJ4486441.1 Spc19-domain-containing protein [Lentinula lateritia]